MLPDFGKVPTSCALHPTIHLLFATLIAYQFPDPDRLVAVEHTLISLGLVFAMSDYCIRDIYVFRSEGSVDTKCRSCCALRSGYLLLHHGFLLSTPLLLMLSCRDECCHDSHLPLQAHMQHQQIIHSQILVMLLPSYLVPCRSFGISQHQASC